MTDELWILVWAAILGLVMVFLPVIAASTREGYFQWNATSREQPFDIGPMAGRLKRAHANFMETFVVFAVVVLVLAVAHRTGPLSVWGSRIYLLGRVLYVPCYAFDIKGVRSLIYAVAFVGLVMCIAAIFV